MLIPRPSTVEWLPGHDFTVAPETVIHVPRGNAALHRVGRQLSDLIGIAAGAQPLPVRDDGDSGTGNAIRLEIGDVPEPGDEAYTLTVRRDGVAIASRTPAGVFYGVQTLRQLLPAYLEHRAVRPQKGRPVHAPGVRIVDTPRFEWRGAMLDVARHFFPVHDVKRVIDLLALYKLNRLHLHLTDDQGWRIEIESWPNLAAHGGSTGVGGGEGGHYTQQQYADLVRYAADRAITVVPEIDMPGHTHAALASYAELNRSGQAPELYTGIVVGTSALCVDTEITARFVEDVIREVAAITPGPYLHVGGDEVQTLTWEQYASFITRVQGIVESHGKRMVAWDEAAAALLHPGAIIQHWRSQAAIGEAVGKGATVISSLADRAYLDMKYDASTPIGLTWAALIDVPRVYEWDPADTAPPAALIGVEAPLWTETVANIRDAEYLLFPRLAAVAEVAWSRAGHRQWEDFATRLAAQGPRWTALGINFYRAPEIPWIDRELELRS